MRFRCLSHMCKMILINANDDVCLKLELCIWEQQRLWKVFINAGSPELSLLASVISTKSHTLAHA